MVPPVVSFVGPRRRRRRILSNWVLLIDESQGLIRRRQREVELDVEEAEHDAKH